MASIERTVSEHTGAVSYRVRYRTPNRKQRSKSFALARDAKRFAAKIETSKVEGGFADPVRGNVLVRDWVTRWLAGKTRLAASTRSRYQTAIDAHILPRWGDYRLSQIHYEDIQDWVGELSQTLAADTVRKTFRVFSQSLSFAVNSKRLAVNPAVGVELPVVTVEEMRFLTHQQVEAVGERIRADLVVLVFLLAYTGLRFGEAAALTVRMVDLGKRRIRVAASVTRVDGVMVWGTTKGRKARSVPIPAFLAPLLAAQMRGKKPRDLVFTNLSGEVIAPGVLRRPLARAAAEIGVEGFRIHDLRHTAASLAIAAGADVKVLQEMLGHESATETLNRYGHMFPDRLDLVAEALNSARERELSGTVCVENVSKSGKTVD